MFIWRYAALDSDDWIEYDQDRVMITEDIDDFANKLNAYMEENPFCSFASKYKRGKLRVIVGECTLDNNWEFTNDESEDEQESTLMRKE